MAITVLLDAGHGGMINGKYQTSGKRSPVWGDGSVLYEGEFNRAIKSRLMEMLQMDGINYVDINPQQIDLSLEDRVDYANVYRENSIYVSIHSNAGGGTGCEVFTAENCSTKSTKLANIFAGTYRNYFPDERWRGVKKRDFYVVKNTAMPAVLIEAFFMDTERECKKYLMTKSGRNQIAKWIHNSIKDYINNYEV
jgi:N-acetylmuramoyl-L-alanine amidase